LSWGEHEMSENKRLEDFDVVIVDKWWRRITAAEIDVNGITVCHGEFRKERE